MRGRSVTLLFTDIEGSTQMLDRLGDRYGDLLSEHHRIMREAIAASGGREVATAGDSFFAVFSRAADAVDCARRAQRALAVAEWPGAEAPKVRMGIHTGSPEVEDGEYVGIDVHRAARVMAVARGGQVLLTEEARRACGSAVEVRDLGYHRLKDLPAPEHLVQLLVRGVENRFAPLRSLNRSNLPSPANVLVGRRTEVARALELLAAEDGRLLTLVGPGGVGKTRLAVEVAAEAATRYRDGVWLEALATIPDRAVMVSELARLLEVDPAPGQSLVQTLLRGAAERELLLVLDNFEHLLPAADVVADLLAAAPGIEILATSREPLRVRGEHRMQVAPLALEDAAELFLVRARAARPELSLNEQDRVAVERICVRLDGLPLALELAAARVAVFAPARLEARLAERLALPAGPRDLPERQQTLRATIDWSYRLLEPGERELFASFSPFIGGVRVDCAEALWGAEGAERLISLWEKSLLRRREDPDAEPRFSMLETVREFALERAAAEHSAAEATARHTDYFFALAEQAAPHLHGRDVRHWLDRLESEHTNLRAALEHLSAHEPGQALRMAGNLTWFWEIRGFRIEARDRLTQVLRSTRPDEPGRGRALVAAGRLASRAGDFAASKSLHLEALPITRQEPDQRLTVLALADLGWGAGATGDEGEMAARYEEAIAIARAAQDDWALGLALNGYSASGPVRGDPERARPIVEEALRLFRRIGDAAGIAHAASTVAEIAMDAGDLEVAERLISESIESAREIDNRPTLAFGLLDQSIISLLRNDGEAADAHLQAAIEASLPYDDREMAADVLSAAATIAATRGETTRAATLWAAANTARGAAREHKSVARLRARWQPKARAEARDQATWDAATLAGADLTLKDALALAARSYHR